MESRVCATRKPYCLAAADEPKFDALTDSVSFRRMPLAMRNVPHSKSVNALSDATPSSSGHQFGSQNPATGGAGVYS
eukprot:347887-Chlamydomonas_euryale.AAC.1